MEKVFVKRRKINEILSLYSGFLGELAISLRSQRGTIDISNIESHALKVLDEKLTDRELTAILEIEGDLSDRFPGVGNRIKELLRKEITESVLRDEL
jgi:hypothetical protein